MIVAKGRSFEHRISKATRAALVARMKAAWKKAMKKLDVTGQARLQSLVDKAHRQLGMFVKRGVPPSHDLKILLFMKSWLENDPDGYLQSVYPQLRPGGSKGPRDIDIYLGGEGQIIGTGQYQELDMLWTLECGTVWLENLFHQHAFPGDPPPILQIGDCTIALAGDFGTGDFDPEPSPSTKVAAAIAALKPDYTIHLGDVYYAATDDEETGNLLGSWPAGKSGSFALNSNHEMYPGGDTYFDLALDPSSIFSMQAGHSCFALEHPNWIIVALDSAYFSSKWTLYRDGMIQGKKKNNQVSFLNTLAQRGKKMILLTHHNPIDIAGQTAGNKLFSQVMSAFPPGAPPPAYWYFGHEHVGAVYNPLPAPNDVLCRCVGHSALPWGKSSELGASQQVKWYESTNAGDPDDTLRVYNGFALLTLSGNTLSETFYRETGEIVWQSGKKPRASRRGQSRSSTKAKSARQRSKK